MIPLRRRVDKLEAEHYRTRQRRMFMLTGYTQEEASARIAELKRAGKASDGDGFMCITGQGQIERTSQVWPPENAGSIQKQLTD